MQDTKKRSIQNNPHTVIRAVQQLTGIYILLRRLNICDVKRGVVMASFIARSERSGNIFFRVTGLIRSKQLPWSDRPIWYDVYVSSPPLSIPSWNVKLPKYDETVRKIFYNEDNVRAMFYKKYKNASIINMENSNESLSQIFVNEYYTVIEKSPDLSESEIFAKVERQMKDSGIDL